VYGWFTEGFDTRDLKEARRCSMSCTPDQSNFRNGLLIYQDLVNSLISCLVIRLPKNVSIMGRLFEAGVFCEGPAMDTRRSYYVHSKQDDFAEPSPDANRLDFNDIPFVMPANDNMRTKDRLSARCGSLLYRLMRSIASVGRTKPMSNVVRSTLQAASQELIAKLVKAGYLYPSQCMTRSLLRTQLLD
jgi:hypothetical protein